jgi:hypothetical protein
MDPLKRHNWLHRKRKHSLEDSPYGPKHVVSEWNEKIKTLSRLTATVTVLMSGVVQSGYNKSQWLRSACNMTYGQVTCADTMKRER